MNRAPRIRTVIRESNRSNFGPVTLIHFGEDPVNPNKSAQQHVRECYVDIYQKEYNDGRMKLYEGNSY